MSSAQQQIYANVEARGYTEGWSHSQFLLRNLFKLQEELAEVADQITPVDHHIPDRQALDDIHYVGRDSRYVFKDSDFDYQVLVPDPSALAKELADCQVVLACMAETLGKLTGEDIDLMQVALEKSGADIERGVRK